ncbi:MAG: hypothetical protein DRI57_05545, partial [Deltaproteobacteria bacterium]
MFEITPPKHFLACNNGFMKKNICKILCTVVFFMVVCVSWSVRADPVWQVGDKWMVKAVYPSSMKKD